MGLYMYLTKKTYVKNWNHQKPEERHSVSVSGPAAGEINAERIREVVEDVAYWRKANAIHRWFVENVQDGNDDCGEYLVWIDKLKELVELCKLVLETVETVGGLVHTGTTFYPSGEIVQHAKPGEVVAQAGLAAGLLPTQAGVFFGNTDYDECYLDDLRETIRQIEPILDHKYGEFYYHSSW